MHWECDDTGYEGVVGIDMLVAVIRLALCVEMGRTVIAAYTHRDKWM